MNYSDALNYIFQGNCILIVGSGFSAGCAIENEGKMPRADELCKIMDEMTGEDSEGDLALSAEYFIENKERKALCELLRKQFTPVELLESQKVIAGQHWKRVYTTNYDDIIEHGGRIIQRKRINGVSLSSDPSDFPDKDNLVIHLNGQIANITPESLDDEFKLTKSSYLATDFKNSRWIDLFEFDLKYCDAIFIVGLSLDYDLDIARLIFSENVKEKTFIISWEKESKNGIKRLSKYGTVLPIGRDQLAQDISQAQANSSHTELKSSNPLTSFSLIRLTTEFEEFTDNKTRDLLIWGNLNQDLLQYSLDSSKNSEYFIYRDKIDTVINIITNGQKNVLIEGNVGNGKTLFVKAVALKLTSLQYKVYYFTHENHKTYEELESICKTGGSKTVIIIESYNSCRRLIEQYATLRSDTTLIVTERTATNDLYFDRLTQCVGEGVNVINLNRLSNNEIKRTIDLLDHINLWGDRAADKSHQKQKFIENKCHSQLRDVLLKILETRPIKEQLERIFKDLGDGNMLKIVVLELLASYASFNIDLYDFSKIIDESFFTSVSFQKNELVREFIDFNTGESKARSSILAEFVLRTFVKPTFLKDTVVEAFKTLDNNRRKYGRVLAALSRHSTLLSLMGLHCAESKELIPRFYDQIKQCNWCKNNPHFWLQYAIAMLEIDDFAAAEIYFENAYSYALNKADFAKIQIDNHYARFLLENAIKNDDVNFWESFSRAHEILVDSRYIKDKKYYPYRVAQNYLPFFYKYRSQMSPKQIFTMKECANNLLLLMDKYIGSTDGPIRLDVQKAKEGLLEITSFVHKTRK